MNENEVVEAVCLKLEARGCEILQRRTTIEKGIDVIAKDPISGEMYFVEAKGGTSSLNGSRRFGKPYTLSQVFDRVAKGIFTSIQLRSDYQNRDHEHVILAVPDSRNFRRYLEPISEQIESAGIGIWYCSSGHALVV